MATHLFALMLIGGMAVGDSGAKPSADQLPAPAAAIDARLEKAARDCRIQIYQTFGNDRAEYDRRQSEVARIQQAWTDAGRNEQEQPLLEHWLDQATARSRIDSIGDLPAAPKFTTMPQKPEPEKKLVDTSGAKSVREAAATVDDLLHVNAAGSGAIVKPNTPPNTSSAPAEKPRKEAVGNPAAKTNPTTPSTTAGLTAPQSKPPSKTSTIGPPAKTLGAEITRAMQILSGNATPTGAPAAAPNAPNQGR